MSQSAKPTWQDQLVQATRELRGVGVTPTPEGVNVKLVLEVDEISLGDLLQLKNTITNALRRTNAGTWRTRVERQDAK